MARTRQRRAHTRSRTGCQPCKKRHIRCDEMRPFCKKCITANLECEYPELHVEVWSSVGTPKATGQQGVFSVWQVPKGLNTGTDPFDSLPTGMPLKSHQLFNYLLYVHKTDCSTPLSKASLAGALQTQSSFRSLLLLAALHYSWNTGHLREYETTYLAHKIECLRTISHFIKDPKRDPRGVRAHLSAIATLCLTDASTGNLEVAETHLDGLTALLDNSDALRSLNRAANEEEKAEDAVLQRYILVCIMEIARMRYERGRIEEASRGTNVDLAKTDASLGAVMPLHKLDDRLAGFWLMPYFLATEDLTCTEVDGAKHLNNLRFLTAHYGGCHPSSLPTGLSDRMTQGWGMNATGMKSYFMQGVVEKHGKAPSPAVSSEFSSSIDSTTPSTSSNTTVTSPENSHSADTLALNGERYAMSWISLTITSGFYLYAVLNLGTSDGSLSVEGRPLLWMIRTLQRDADAAFEHLLDKQYSAITHKNKRSPELSLWTLFMGAFTVAGLHHIAAASGRLESSMPGGEATFQELEAWFAVRIRAWSELTGVTEWEGEGGARDALAAVVWPLQAKGEPLAKAIWEGALGKYPGMV